MSKIYFFLFFVLFSASLFAQTPITGTMVVCAGSTTTLHNATTGGYWLSGDLTIATIDSFTGVLTGHAAGTVSIGYYTSSWAAAATITVNPAPTLSSSLTPPSICDSMIFNYTPLSITSGTTFMWSRAAAPGVGIAASSGSGNPNEQLINTTYAPIGVSYVYTLSAAGCTNVQTVTVTVNPVPALSSTLTPPAICDSAWFSYSPTSLTPGASYAWNRPLISGILLPTAFGTGSIHEILDNTTSSPITVTYFFRLSIAGCINLYPESVQVVVGTCRVGIQELSKENDVIKVYPNPSSSAFTVEAPAGTSVSVADLAGKVLITRTIAADVTPVVARLTIGERLTPGTYLVRATMGERTYVQKVVIW